MFSIFSIAKSFWNHFKSISQAKSVECGPPLLYAIANSNSGALASHVYKTEVILENFHLEHDGKSFQKEYSCYHAYRDSARPRS